MRASIVSSTIAVLTTVGLAGRASADFDLSPQLGAGNKIVTNAFQDADETLVTNVRVFSYAFGEVPGQPYFLSDPGFHPQPDSSGFAPGSAVGFKLASPLRYWSGTGSPGFNNVANATSIRFDFGANSVVSTGGSVPSPAGYNFAVIDANGEADDHLETYLLAPGGTIMAPGTPAAGVYLVTINVTSSTSGIVPSDPAFLLFGNDVSDDTLDNATLYVRDHFAPGSNLAQTPEPSTAALLLSTTGLITARRRRL